MSTFISPQNSAVGTDHRGSLVLPQAACLQRVAAVPVGRVGFRSGGDVLILPVNHLVSGTTVVFRTEWGAKVEALSDGTPVSFEADAFDARSRTGWSVLVKGTAEWVTDDSECQELDRRAGASWLPAGMDPVWIRIRPEEITGRELGPLEPTAAPATPA
ncbi:MAG TPA: pyridoxamine 5'-phosphate oxidase family protein [Segeticoccus sp.]|uniref:pyridoxamine 5'-phosphate oxidase family protein n=1 Tax=Segeticoccus sp. TaxID=2706531 RepID=UPI002D7EFB4B|nr:pyridoxamine 5'-phosphate oxidase family protein [Segeticoccus sp.]HET8600990.1 pyridoxamine 5'-phosphate oxidase family protein [Segeticoccus sp.]